jgi:hypothetical protein
VSVDPGVGGLIPVAVVGVVASPPSRALFGAICVKDDVDRLKGFFRIGFGDSSDGTGGASLFFPLLKAFRMDAKDGFLEKAVLVVAKEDWEECEKAVLGLLA